ncbi:MAG: hypothetical protein ACP5O1_13010, partial [Phycisphaerae bacterium]
MNGYGNLDQALYGGSGGGGASGGSGGSGGGGALDITAVGSVSVAGITALGGGGGINLASGGGGSGGAIILSGNTVSDSRATVTPYVLAYGMSGGHASLNAGGGGSFGGAGLGGSSGVNGYDFSGDGGNGQVLIQSTSPNQSTSFAFAGNIGGVT